MSRSRQKTIAAAIALAGIATLFVTGLFFRSSLREWYDVWRFPWGKPVDGIQVRLQPHRLVWNSGEDPTFTLQLRNTGTRRLAIYSLASLVLELDDEIFGPKVWFRSGFIKLQPFETGNAYDFHIAVGQFGGGEQLASGKHSVRVALLDNASADNLGFSTTLANYPDTALAFSRTVTIQVVATKQ